MSEKIDLNIDELKNISREIIHEELEKYGLKSNVYPITFIEFYNKELFKNKLKLANTFDNYISPFNSGGFNIRRTDINVIVIFINQYNKIPNLGKKIFTLAYTCYHEARHTIQKEFDKYSYEGFLYNIEHLLKFKIDNDYNKNHDKYSFEIGANLYGVEKAREYLKTRYPSLYEKQKVEIDLLEKQYKLDYLTYDASDIIDRTIQYLKSNNTSMKKYYPNYQSKLLTKTSPVLPIFLNNDASFKKLEDIMKNEKFKSLDKRIVYAILSSNSFLEQVDINELNLQELNLINDALTYTKTLYENQVLSVEKYLNEKQISYEEYLKSTNIIIHMLKKLAKIIGTYMLDEIDELQKRYEKQYEKPDKNQATYIRDEEKRQLHIQSIPTYQEKIVTQINSRKSK